ncbi:SLC13 family permease [Agrilactobacillus fermenti]|uniref:SLC13 family permease n=1 Tax=Agrilactobacillus fermenti TaxID=2586909 RepID=UPI003A5BF6EE
MAILKHISKDRVLQITVVIALISLFFARPHIQDINFSTLFSLLAMMTVIQIFEYLHILDFWAYRLTTRSNNAQQLTRLFLILAFISAMFLTNDMTVLTLVPLYLKVAKRYDLPEVVPVTLIGMTANIGSALTPFGNPHNIFLLSHYDVPIPTFFKWSIPLAVCGILMVGIFSLLIRRKEVPAVMVYDIKIQKRPTLLAGCVVLLVFLSVFKIIPSWISAIAAVALALGLDRHIMAKVDYALILTFVGFFIIVSNLGQIQPLVALLSLLEHSKLSVYLSSLGVSQLISNVPSTILLARFTHHAIALFFGSNIGGLGTFVASMANLLLFKQYTHYGTRKRSTYLTGFFSLNIIGLIVLGSLGWGLINLLD